MRSIIYFVLVVSALALKKQPKTPTEVAPKPRPSAIYSGDLSGEEVAVYGSLMQCVMLVDRPVVQTRNESRIFVEDPCWM
mmetsp:Transcript_541/g.1564  ORF Transcript_541/g.1564 Transcript_541/m.1564 type:complete len:80 (+) Transcript_541:164-403(+)|eukprot:CAMPEP_0119260046 /NCGR_PEP_ID=MMETSP1329-20130426/616_1 /TAXON_ID=114041 /ORGANISM="Genus nov. species nov., Strain RCC1024" /LENGTH=79 /DNA_ID=CAMNT_0007259459 /DNA_START=129 /DNA_END=368 /DNA_ORIENTATION=-